MRVVPTLDGRHRSRRAAPVSMDGSGLRTFTFQVGGRADGVVSPDPIRPAHNLLRIAERVGIDDFSNIELQLELMFGTVTSLHSTHPLVLIG